MSSEKSAPFAVLSGPHQALVTLAQEAKERLNRLLSEGRRDVLAEQQALFEYQAFLAAADYLVGYDGTPKFTFIVATNA